MKNLVKFTLVALTFSVLGLSSCAKKAENTETTTAPEATTAPAATDSAATTAPAATPADSASTAPKQ